MTVLRMKIFGRQVKILQMMLIHLQLQIAEVITSQMEIDDFFEECYPNIEDIVFVESKKKNGTAYFLGKVTEVGHCISEILVSFFREKGLISISQQLKTKELYLKIASKKFCHYQISTMTLYL